MRNTGLRQAGRIGGVVIASALLAGCLRPERELQASFNAEAHGPWMGKGTAAIDGEAFIRRPNGWLARCSGNEVMLVPASAYFREWVGVYRQGARVQNSGEVAAQHRAALRKTQCDQNGRFSFSDLPAGKWFITTRISYRGANDPFAEDAAYLIELETKTGEVAKAILSNPNRI